MLLARHRILIFVILVAASLWDTFFQFDDLDFDNSTGPTKTKDKLIVPVSLPLTHDTTTVFLAQRNLNERKITRGRHDIVHSKISSVHAI